MEHEKKEALERGFKTYQEFAAYRCNLKRELRKAGIQFETTVPTTELERLSGDSKLKAIDKLKYEDIPADVKRDEQDDKDNSADHSSISSPGSHYLESFNVNWW